jgi:hypothetical protein
VIEAAADVGEQQKAACEANLSTPYEEAAKYGADAEQILLARARFLARAAEIEREFGLEPGTLTKESPERIESVSRQAAECAAADSACD